MGEYVELEGATSTPTRVVGANIPFDWLIYVIALVVVVVVVWGSYRKIRTWSVKPLEGGRPKLSGIVRNVAVAFSQKRMVSSFGPVALFHIFIVFGFIVLMLNSALHAMSKFLGWPIIEGTLYIATSISADVSGALLFVGLVGLLVVKFIVRPDRQKPASIRSALLLLAFAFSVLSGYFVEGARIASQFILTDPPGALDYEMIASPIGWQVAKLFSGMSLDDILLAHRIGWWVHAIFNMCGLASLPFGRMWHVMAAMFNGVGREPGEPDEIEDFEDEDSLGAQRVKNLKWSDLADLDACIDCGACSKACPANGAGYPLNPKLDLIASIREEKKRVSKGAEPRDLSEVIGNDALWSCVTCRACADACPLHIDHVSKLIDVRRRVSLWDEEAPDEAQQAFINLDMNQNPWGMGYAARADWVKACGLDDVLVDLTRDPAAEVDYVLFAGCFAAYDLRYRKAAAAGVRPLSAHGLKIGYLGVDEACCGDSARRLGNEFLYRQLAETNIETFKRYSVKALVTMCPHCLNTLGREYPRIDADMPPVRHIADVLDEVMPHGSVSAARDVLVQEPCYLARYNAAQDKVEELLRSQGARVVNPGDTSGPTCCGGGGGCMWLDDSALQKAKRIGSARLEALEHAAARAHANDPIVVTSCPYCMSMMQDAVSEEGSALRVLDASELLWQAHEQAREQGCEQAHEEREASRESDGMR